ncbi:MAG: ribonuclease [Solirubrobacteraceae bacterium]|jgi:ribonuclease HI|nr:ribonuclease [Solirubrobacteraceae bacterium]
MARRRAPRRPGGTLRDGERRQLAYASRRAAAGERPAPAAATHRVLCDGGSRGNPGPAAVAAVLLAPAGGEIEARAEPIGRATAAEAEYRAILLGLELAAAHGIAVVELCSDSRLAIEAIERGATGPAADVRAAAAAFAGVAWRWHPRAQNEAADALVRALLW